jgi:hypothetical protein
VLVEISYRSTVIFFFSKRFQNSKSDPKFGQKGVILVVPMPGRKDSRMPFQLASF